MRSERVGIEPTSTRKRADDGFEDREEHQPPDTLQPPSEETRNTNIEIRNNIEGTKWGQRPKQVVLNISYFPFDLNLFRISYGRGQSLSPLPFEFRTSLRYSIFVMLMPGGNDAGTCRRQL